MTLLIVGATGTLGRQIARHALDEGYQVRCLVRSFQRAAFLREWGAELVRGNLCSPESLAPAFAGVTAVIDAATARPTDALSIRQVDWDGKLNLIQAARDAAVERYVFFSILNSEKFPNVPLMDVKRCTELYLEESGLNYTTLKACGFMQGLIGQYAIPILENQAVWVTGQTAPTAYMNTQDIARFAIQALRLPETERQTYPMVGSRAWTAYEIIRLCEQKSGRTARISQMPLGLLRGVKRLARFFQWGQNLADRLAFAEVVATGQPLDASMEAVYTAFQIDPQELTTLEDYMSEYFSRIMRKLKELNFDSDRFSKKQFPF